MTTTLRHDAGDTAKFAGHVMGHGPDRDSAVTEATDLAGGPVEILAATEITGSWTVLARALGAR